jgi:hypothetical protein
VTDDRNGRRASRVWGGALAALRSPATATFLWSRAAIWLVALLGYAMLPPHKNAFATRWDTPIQHDLGWATDIWAHWDGGWFLRIAEHSYASDVGTAAFYPLYPGALAIVGRIFGGHFIVAGIVLSLVAGLAAVVVLESLAVRLVGESGRRTVLYLMLFPMSFFLQAVYSEAFFLALAVAAFALAERARPGWAATVAGFALLARPTGVAVVAGIAVLAWRSPQRRRALAWLGVVPVLFAGFPLTLGIQTSHPWSFLDVEATWGRRLSDAGPFGGIWQGLRAGAVGLRTLVDGRGPDILGFDKLEVAAVNLEAAVFLLLFLWLAVETWRRLPLQYSVFVTVSLIIPLSLPSTQGFPLLSMPRLGLVIFPFFVVLAQMDAHRPRLGQIVLGSSAMLLGFSVVQWALWYWVA